MLVGTGEAVQADREVAQGGHDLRGGSGSGLGAPAALLPGPGADRAALADDLDGLGGVRELDPRSDGDDLARADLAAAVRGRDGAMGDLDLTPWASGELAAQPGLVALDRQHPVRAPGVQVGDVLALGVTRPR
jgi:hypothetical protein